MKPYAQCLVQVFTKMERYWILKYKEQMMLEAI